MARILKKMGVLLDKKQKWTMAGLMVLMVIGAFLQTAGVGLLVQVVSVVIDPLAVEKSDLVRAFRLRSWCCWYLPLRRRIFFCLCSRN